MTPAPDLVGALLPRCTFAAPGTPLRCGVSGGADSLALLVLALAAGLEVTAVHVDHGLRRGSAAEADLVAGHAARLGSAFEGHRAEVPPGPNLEARARAARRRLLDGAATGHTADDQAETVLGNLLRGAGPDGVAGMRPGPRHPILGLRRRETHQLCTDLGLAVVRDPTNDDPAHRRNRLRHEALPLLADIGARDPVPLLVRAADHARAAVDELDRQAATLEVTDAAALREAPVELARRAVRRWLRQLNAERHPPDTATVARVLAVARGEAVATEVGGGARVARRGGRLRIEGPIGVPRTLG